MPRQETLADVRRHHRGSAGPGDADVVLPLAVQPLKVQREIREGLRVAAVVRVPAGDEILRNGGHEAGRVCDEEAGGHLGWGPARCGHCKFAVVRGEPALQMKC